MGFDLSKTASGLVYNISSPSGCFHDTTLAPYKYTCTHSLALCYPTAAIMVSCRTDRHIPLLCCHMRASTLQWSGHPCLHQTQRDHQYLYARAHGIAWNQHDPAAAARCTAGVAEGAGCDLWCHTPFRVQLTDLRAGCEYSPTQSTCPCCARSLWAKYRPAQQWSRLICSRRKLTSAPISELASTDVARNLEGTKL